MDLQLLRHGSLHSPYFIFVRCGHAYSDLELLAALGVDGFTLNPDAVWADARIMVADDGEWVHLADNWGYTLWHMHLELQAIPSLAQLHDVFTCSVGDSDSSLEFTLYRAGAMVRRFNYEDNLDGAASVVDDIGNRLPQEPAVGETESLDAVLALASSLGIDVHHSVENIRVYTRPRAGDLRPPATPN